MILIVLIVLVLVILFYNKSMLTYTELSVSDLTKKLYNGDKLNGYRLADVIFYPDYLTQNHKYTTVDHLYNFQDTIGVEYLRRKYPFLQKIKSREDFQNYNSEYSDFENYINSNIKSIKLDMNLLNQIIKEKNKESKSINNDALFLHVRVGDVLCKYPQYDHASVYAKKGNFNWWKQVINYIKQNGITDVVIIAGTHFKDCLEESAMYIQEISDFLKSYNLKVSYRIGNSPDDDLIFCKNAKHFITTGGGYGYFLGKIVELNGGNFVLNKKDTIRKDISLFNN